MAKGEENLYRLYKPPTTSNKLIIGIENGAFAGAPCRTAATVGTAAAATKLWKRTSYRLDV